MLALMLMTYLILKTVTEEEFCYVIGSERYSCPAYTSGCICPCLLLPQNVNPLVILYCLLALDSTACASEYNRCFWLGLRVTQHAHN
jgi:hypothetical protein